MICFALLEQVLHSSLLVSIPVTAMVVQAGSHVSNAGNLVVGLGKGSRKAAVLLDFVLITSPSPKFEQLVKLYLNAKNVDFSDIQNYSLSKILLV